jgi:hypothetical protein
MGLDDSKIYQGEEVVGLNVVDATELEEDWYLPARVLEERDPKVLSENSFASASGPGDDDSFAGSNFFDRLIVIILLSVAFEPEVYVLIQ